MVSFNLALLSGIIVLMVGALLHVLFFVGRRGHNFPDGPPTWPVIGNLHQLPKEKQYFQFTEWAKKYGGMYTLKLGTRTAVVLTDRRIIKQLIDKKAATSSNRPKSEVGQMIGEGDHMLLMDNTPTWWLFRKQIHQSLTESLCDKSHSKVQHAEIVQMLHDMLQAPEAWTNHLKRFSNSVIMSIVYGIRSPTVDTSHMRKLIELVEIWARIIEFGATPPIDIFPFLKLIPQRFLGNWITRAAAVHDAIYEFYNGLLQTVLRRRESTGSMNCLIDRLLDEKEKTNLNTHQITLLCGDTVNAGSETLSAVITSCIQALVTWPDVKKKAQAEIDAVIEEDRIPSWSDYEKLPYVAAVVKEAIRWRPVAPLSVPHALSEDEWVDGKFLPKGTVCILNVWGLHHDEAQFPNSDTFDPDRYKGRTLLAADYANSADYENRDHYGYGNGRRICPGIHLADRGLFQAISKILWAFDISMATDHTTGKPIVPDTSMATGYHEGLTVCANDFPIQLQVRSRVKRDIIMKEFAEAKANFFAKYETVQFP